MPRHLRSIQGRGDLNRVLGQLLGACGEYCSFSFQPKRSYVKVCRLTEHVPTRCGECVECEADEQVFTSYGAKQVQICFLTGAGAA